MTTITDEYMLQMRAKTRNYTIVILKAGPNKHQEGSENIIWEHGRRNFGLRADGVLAIVCPVDDDSEVCGLYIFNAPVEEVPQIMDEDPGVKAALASTTCKSRSLSMRISIRLAELSFHKRIWA